LTELSDWPAFSCAATRRVDGDVRSWLAGGEGDRRERREGGKDEREGRTERAKEK